MISFLISPFTCHFIYSSDESGKKCTERRMPEDAKFPMIWDWLKDAKCYEVHDKRDDKMYYAWTERVSMFNTVEIIGHTIHTGT